MSYNPSQTRTWDQTTAADGDYFEAEFNRVYANTAFNHDDLIPVGSEMDYFGAADPSGWLLETRRR